MGSSTRTWGSARSRSRSGRDWERSRHCRGLGPEGDLVKVLVVDHTAGVAPFRRKFAALAAQPGLDLTVVAPERWIETYREIRMWSGRQDGYEVLAGRVFWPGYENRGFFVSGLGSAIRRIRPDLIHLWEEPYSLIALQTLFFVERYCPRVPVLFSSSDDMSHGFRYPYRPSFVYGAI